MRVIAGAGLVLVLAFAALAQDTVPAPGAVQNQPRPEVLGKQSLNRDLVSVSDGKMHYQRVNVCTVVRPQDLGGGVSQPIQARVRAEAPAGGFISRDQFLLFTAEIALSLRMWFADQIAPGMNAVQALAAVQCRGIAEAVGDPDLELEIIMTPNGIVRTLRENRTGTSDQQSVTWEDVL